MNDDMAAARTAHPDRLRWFASLPWQYPERALPELERAIAAGASGVMVLANIDGRPLTDPAFAPIWSAIDAKGAAGARASDGAARRRRDGHGPLPAHRLDRLHVRHVARGRADDLRRLLRPLSQAADHRGARRRRAAVPRSRGWTSASTTFPRAARRSPCGLRSTCRGSSPTRSCSRPKCSTFASRCSAPTTCCTAPTIRTRSATCRDASKRVNGLAGCRARQGARPQRAARVRVVVGARIRRGVAIARATWGVARGRRA